MSTCGTCHGNPCKCCEHRCAPGTCAECANEEAEALRNQIVELREDLDGTTSDVARLREEVLYARLVRAKLRQIAAAENRSERERELLLDLVEALGGNAAG